MKPPKSSQQVVTVVHNGPLTMSSLESSLPSSLFRPAGKGSGDDSLHMGWEHVTYQNLYMFRLENFLFGTAEGIVTLAAMVDCLRNGTQSKVDVVVGPDSKSWAGALHLEQLVNDKWRKSFPITPSRVEGGLTHPLWRYPIHSRSDCEKTAQRLSRQVAHLLDRLGLEHTNEVAAAARIVFHEALLNVFEHAYGEHTGGLVFEAITITPIPRREQLKKLAYVTEQERKWFASHAGLMLEVAIADYGRNVPSTLWEAYAEVREHAEDVERAAGLRLGTREGQAARASLHHKIALWAFNHKSTRKREGEFADKLAQLNWRGLHRALNTAARFDACVIMRSGQARTGYAFDQGKANALETVEIPQREFPGTSIVLRIPLNKPQSASPGPSARQPSPEQTPAIRLKKIVECSKLTPDLTDSHAGRSFSVGIVHPFSRYDDAGVMELRRLTASISPLIVGIHLFASPEPDVLTRHLQAFEDKPSALDLGMPRLIAFWNPGRNLQWSFVGLMPEYVRTLVKNIEEHGVTNIPQEGEVRVFAEQLTRAYPSFLKIEKDFLHLKQFNYRLLIEDIDQAMQMAFGMWCVNTESSWLFDQAGKYVRLTTGRPVKRYVSLFKMLYTDDTLSHVLGWRFATLLRQLQRDHPGICIVTESEASYFIAKILLQGQSIPIDIYIGPPPPTRGQSGRPVLAFADAIYRGETLSKLLESLQNCKRVICCLDLRATVDETFGGPDIPITSLLRLSFEPGEVALTPSLHASDVLEVDRVTHIPVEGPPAESFLLGTNDERVFFINENSHLFLYGLHMSGGRLHVVSISNEEIVQKHRGELFKWIVDIVSGQLAALGAAQEPVDIVFFTRAETSIKDIVEELGAKLPAHVEGVGGTFSAVLPFVPTGPREVFSRPTPELYYEAQRLNPTDLLSEQPSRFLAVYLDDACVTGRSLLNFLIRVSKARPDQLPAAILAIPMLSRFSPAEEQFYGSVFRSVDVMSHGDPRDARIPFSFSPLFRLQVRSFEKLQSTFVYELASKIHAQAAFLDNRLQGYVAKVIQRLEGALSSPQRGSSDLVILQHPFFGRQETNSTPVSSRAIRIRHLIALQEQNVGVLGELLHELLDAVINDDYSLLTVMALELNLLEVPPLLKECRADIVALAIKALAAPDTTAEIKSDAICVLSMTGQELISEMGRILPRIGNDSDLIDQFLVFLLLTKMPHTNFWLEDLDNTIRNCAAELPPEEYRYISSCVKSLFEVDEPLSVQSTPDAIHAIENLVAQTSYHGHGLTALNAINNWLSKKEQDRIHTRGTEVQFKLREAIKVVRRTVLPGLEGLLWWAEYESPNQAAVVAFEGARVRLILCLNHLENTANMLKTGPVGSDVVIGIEKLWHTLREYSQRIGPEYFLSQQVGSPEVEPTILERWMPKFFCLPFQILYRLAPSFLPKVKVTNGWERSRHGFSIMMTPAPLDQVTQIFELLLSDMRSHGSDDDNAIELSLSDTDGAKVLAIDFQDRVRQGDEPGTGRSQSKVLSLAEPLGLKVRFDRPRYAGEMYRVQVVFTNVLCIKCY